MTDVSLSATVAEGIGGYASGQVVAHHAGDQDNIAAVVVVADAVCSAAEQLVDRDKG